MRRLLVVALLSSTLFAAVPRDGGGRWFRSVRDFVHHVLHFMGSTGDYITPPKP